MAARHLFKCLEPTSLITPDVTFVFKEEDDKVNKEVKAHKVILATASDVFEREFYGAMKETSEVIIIEDACQEVFQVMVNYIYNQQPQWEVLGISLICSLYYLAEKYNIGDLRDDIILNLFFDLEVTKDTFVEVANLAKENMHWSRP